MKKFLLVALSLITVSNFSLPVYADELNKEVLSTQKTTAKKSIIILDFDIAPDVYSKYDLKKAIYDRIIKNLSNYQNFTIVEHLNVEKAVKDLDIYNYPIITSKEAIKITEKLGSEYVILGTLSKKDNIFDISAQLLDSKNSRNSYNTNINFSKKKDFLESVDSISMEMVDFLGEKKLSSNFENDIGEYKLYKDDPNYIIPIGVTYFIVLFMSFLIVGINRLNGHY